ncbi:hypothetical protein [Streptomyces globisporus]|uniref:hypothetical protein n=1 Tax=Streptomyces globisporus TaxID=1908 RepID=UPI00381CCA3F
MGDGGGPGDGEWAMLVVSVPTRQTDRYGNLIVREATVWVPDGQIEEIKKEYPNSGPKGSGRRMIPTSMARPVLVVVGEGLITAERNDYTNRNGDTVKSAKLVVNPERLNLTPGKITKPLPTGAKR